MLIDSHLLTFVFRNAKPCFEATIAVFGLFYSPVNSTNLISLGTMSFDF